ncbi:fibrillin [Geminocystis sp. NIES-3708]|uniref:PAP/fibrillin family protein n=1 Tax=Geminocystis sp. NIES-3708 TaxID=1615909 RepID=UPI0005FCB194|nr:PAP/fibrillin family protein [Geminocystis sp. NIES-3708]BAQ61385.1 fibrillin [Geminocystis sp. NIES-3708]
MNSRLILKETLLSVIKNLAQSRKINPEYPITDLMLSPSEVSEIEQLTINLESYNPFPRPLFDGVNLLDGIWQLHYSTAREIRSLNKLPFGFQLQQVYQIIDTQKASFFNIAFVRHSSGLMNGAVKVTATFAPKIIENEVLPKDIINVNFQKRFLSIKKILGLKTSLLDPFKVFNARNPQGRIPSLKVTYIDESLRIGRGGDGSLFILSKKEKMIN